MTNLKLLQLTKVEQLFDEGKLDEALEILDRLSQFKALDFEQMSYFQFLKGLILFYQNKSEDLVKFGEQVFKAAKNHNENLHAIDGLFFSIIGLAQTYKFDKILELIDVHGFDSER